MLLLYIHKILETFGKINFLPVKAWTKFTKKINVYIFLNNRYSSPFLVLKYRYVYFTFKNRILKKRSSKKNLQIALIRTNWDTLVCVQLFLKISQKSQKNEKGDTLTFNAWNRSRISSYWRHKKVLCHFFKE